MLRLIGGVLLFSGACLLGFSVEWEKKRKTENLREVTFALRMMERELDARMTPIPELLELAGRQTNGRLSAFFGTCAGFSRKRDGLFEEHWRKETEKLEGELGKQGVSHLLRLGREMGRYGWEEEKRAFSMTAEELEEEICRQEAEACRCAPLYRALGVTGGAMLVILLL